jgi:fumarate hydratase class I
MSTPAFHYSEPFPLGPDPTEYRLLSTDGVSTATFEGKTILKVAPEALTHLAREAYHDANFYLRPAHLEQVAGILADLWFVRLPAGDPGFAPPPQVADSATCPPPARLQ